MVTNEIVRQVYALRHGRGFATGFTISVTGSQYLVTARHFLDAMTWPVSGTVQLEVKHAGSWHPLECQEVGRGTSEQDVAVLAVRHLLSGFREDSILGTTGTHFGQEAYFLGFPYGWDGGQATINDAFPMPYVKRSIVSMIEHDQKVITLDGINNPGFSGGPVVIKNSGGHSQIIGVIAGYNYVRAPVFVGGSDEEAEYTVEANTGLIDATWIEVVQKLIAANPVGMRFPPNIQ